MIEIITGILAVLAGAFSIIAAIGVLRFPDALSRMHASSKVAIFASGLALVAVAIYFAEISVVTRAFIIIVFLMMTAPIGAHLLGRAAAWRADKWDRPPRHDDQ